MMLSTEDMIAGNRGLHAQPSVSGAYAKGLLELAVAKGAEPSALLQQSGISSGALEDPDNRIPFAHYVALMRAAKRLSGDAALALHYGEINIARISLIGLIGQASETMGEALAQINRYVKVVVDVDVGASDRFQLRSEQDGLWLTDTRRDPNAFPELTESAFAQLVCGPRALGMGRFATAVYVTHAMPPYREEYDRIFLAPVIFESDRNALAIDPATLTRRIALLPRYAFGVFSERADRLLEDLERSSTVKGRVQSLLLPVLHKGEANMDAVSTGMGMSRQTLYRHLKAEGATFEKALDELRHRMALDYLRARKVSVNQTAYLVGFSDPAAFSRAFKRWTGITPRDARLKA